MHRLTRLRNWSLRAKLAGLMIAVSLVPIGISTLIEVRDVRAQLLTSMRNLLEARADLIVHEFDRTHEDYQNAMVRVSSYPSVKAFCSAPEVRHEALAAAVLGVLHTFPMSDPHIRAAGVVGVDGRIVLATESELLGRSRAGKPTVDAVLAGERVISSVDLSDGGATPSVNYLVPVRDARGNVRCAVALWVRAAAFWNVLKASKDLGGPGSYAVVYDRTGVRIGHSFDDASVFHPAGPLDAGDARTLSQLSAFGPATPALLESVQPFPEQFHRARAALPDRSVFRGFSPANNLWNYGVGRRLTFVPWTVFYMAPEVALLAQVRQATLDKLYLAAAMVTMAVMVGLFFATSILRNVRALRTATQQLASGDASARVPQLGQDELGQLAESFNGMAEQLQQQATALRATTDTLEDRVRERTREIRESQRLLDGIVNNTSALIYVKDLVGRFVLVNDRFCEVFEVTRENVLGKTDHQLFPKGSADAYRQADVAATASMGPVTIEEDVPLPDGVHTYVSLKCPLREPDGTVKAVFGISTDITDRKQAESLQRAQLERLNLLDQITSAISERQDIQSIYQVLIRSLEERLPLDFACICDVDPSLEMLTVARVGVRSLPLALDISMEENARIEVDHNGLSSCVQGQLVYENDIQDSVHPFPSRLARGGLRSLVITPLMSNSQVFGVLVAARRAPDAFVSADCEFLRQLGSHAALAAHQVKLYEDVRLAYDELKRTQETVLQHERLSALGQMASGIAHDINNALSPVSLYAETLIENETGLSDHAREYLQIIARAIDDVAATVARMREFYRPDDPDAQRTPVLLNDMAQQVADLTRPRWSDLARQQNISITVDLQLAEGLPEVVAFEHEVREALVNLFFNAADAMPEGGTLTVRTGVSTAQDFQGAFIEVSDTGVGMDEETRRRCMEPFFTTKGSRGTGLGLAMVYGIAQRHGAVVDVQSAPGTGTSVRLTFPLAQLPDVPAASAHSLAPGGPLRVLLVDDDPLILRSMQSLLVNDGHDVVCCAGGREGIERFGAERAGSEPFDVVITDLGMPEVSGYDVAAAIKAAAPSTFVILLTGWGQRLLQEGSASEHIDKVLSKPPKAQAIRAALSSIHASHRSEPHAS